MGIQSTYDEIPAGLNNAKALFDESEAKLEAVKLSFREDIATLGRTLPPKEAFELRLRYLDCIQSHYQVFSDEEEGDEDGDYKYMLGAKGHFSVEDEDKAFVEDDDRYRVYWSGVVMEDHDGFTEEVHVGFMPINESDDE
jgi:hypothetical protein